MYLDLFYNLFRLFRDYIQADYLFSALFGSKATLLAVGAVLLLQAGFTYIPTMQYFFGSVSLGFMHWLYIVCLGGVIFVCVEIEKYLLRRKKKK